MAASKTQFQGFPKESLAFFSSLKENNNKEWFDEHRSDYEHYVKKTAESFVVAMGEELKKLRMSISAIPKVNQSIFRINRDIRFSKDKSPYKPSIGIIFWEGVSKKESPGFYFHIDDKELAVMGGLYEFTKEAQDVFRQSVIHQIYGKQLNDIVQELTDKKYNLKGQAFKKIPRGYEDHKSKELLLHGGLYTGRRLPISDDVHSAKLIDLCIPIYRDLLPLHEWFVEMMGRV